MCTVFILNFSYTLHTKVSASLYFVVSAAGKHTVEGIQKKLSNIFDKLGIPIQAFISTGKGSYRKPALGMWNFFKEQVSVHDTMYNSGCIYCDCHE